MTRTGESGMLVAAAGVAAFGVTLVLLAGGQTIDARIGLTFAVMVFAFGMVHFAIRRWAPSASTVILPLFKVATHVKQYQDRLLLHLPTSCPVKALLQRVTTLLTAIPVPALNTS